MDHLVSIVAMSLTQQAYLATVVFGIAAGLLGSFVVVRRVALVGDTLSHAILPGVVLGFIVCFSLDMDRNAWVIFFCTAAVGLLSIAVVNLIQHSTRIKADTAMGVVLAGFFGIGLAMIAGLRDYYDASASIESYIFGSIATISEADVYAMMIVCAVMLIAVVALLRPLSVVSFDRGFAVSLGYPIKFLDVVFYAMLTLTIVVSMQAMGVIMVSAMLITPAASAFLLTNKLPKMMVFSVGFAVLSSLLGCYLSINVDVGSYRNMPTGALITLAASAFFALTYFFAPHHGVLAKSVKLYNRKRRVRRENTLKAIYKLYEDSGFNNESVPLAELTQLRRISVADTKRELNNLIKKLLAITSPDGETVTLTSEGWRRASEIVRIHRLWELYLINQADYEEDHVHDDAERIEHMVGPEILQRLEEELDFPKLDPHGKPIPEVLTSNMNA